MLKVHSDLHNISVRHSSKGHVHLLSDWQLKWTIISTKFHKYPKGNLMYLAKDISPSWFRVCCTFKSDILDHANFIWEKWNIIFLNRTASDGSWNVLFSGSEVMTWRRKNYWTLRKNEGKGFISALQHLPSMSKVLESTLSITNI